MCILYRRTTPSLARLGAPLSHFSCFSTWLSMRSLAIDTDTLSAHSFHPVFRISDGLFSFARCMGGVDLGIFMALFLHMS